MSNCSSELTRRINRLEHENEERIKQVRRLDHQLLAARGIIARQSVELVRLRKSPSTRP